MKTSSLHCYSEIKNLSPLTFFPFLLSLLHRLLAHNHLGPSPFKCCKFYGQALLFTVTLERSLAQSNHLLFTGALETFGNSPSKQIAISTSRAYLQVTAAFYLALSPPNEAVQRLTHDGEEEVESSPGSKKEPRK